MLATVDANRREVVERAVACAPFLREAAAALREIVDRFCSHGADAAIDLALNAGHSEEVAVALRKRRRALALAVALGDLAGELSLEQVTAALSSFADAAIDAAIAQALAERVPEAEARGVAAIALGKLGSRELNYSSDVDLILLFDPTTMPRREREDPAEAAVRVGQRIVELLQRRTGEGYVLRVDLRLRPSPEVTPIVLPLNAAIAYYESHALAWERAAFIRARACAGDMALGTQFLDAVRPFVWRRALDFGAIGEIREITHRIRDHYAQGQQFGPGFDLKRGRGGIREVEFFAQVHQLIHGGRDPSLQRPATLDALQALAAAGLIDAEDATALATAYRLLRTTEHRVQMMEDQQTHRLPGGEALDRVAELDGLSSGAELLDRLRPHVEQVGWLFDGFASDELDRLSSDPERLHREVADLGFTDVETVVRRIGEWRSGRVRALRSPAALSAFEAMLPTMLKAIGTGPDPAHALNRFSDLVDRLSSGVNLFRLIEARPALGELVALILAQAPALAEQLARRTELLDGLIDDSSFEPPPPVAELISLFAEADGSSAYDATLDHVRRLVNERRFALGVQLVARRSDPLAVGEGYARVAEAALVALTDAAVEEFTLGHGRIDQSELVILALGRLGGSSLTHASDLDLIFLFTGPLDGQSDGRRSLGPTDYFNRLGARVVAALSVPTAAGALYEVDTRLRPQGRKGLLAVSLESFADYQRNQAWTWEHMALTRARPVYGSSAARAQLDQLVAEIQATPRERTTVVSDVRNMRAEVARHKPPAGPLDIKLGPGGLVDLEFAVQLLQLATGGPHEPRLDRAIDALIDAGLMTPECGEANALLTRMLVTMRLVAPDGLEPKAESRPLVAAACGHSNWDSLLAAHDSARQCIANFWKEVSEQ